METAHGQLIVVGHDSHLAGFVANLLRGDRFRRAPSDFLCLVADSLTGFSALVSSLLPQPSLVCPYGQSKTGFNFIQVGTLAVVKDIIADLHPKLLILVDAAVLLLNRNADAFAVLHAMIARDRYICSYVCGGFVLIPIQSTCGRYYEHHQPLHPA
jgi:hypothetical protein